MVIKPNRIKMTPQLIFAILLLEGFSTISIEILSIRQLLPFVGNSVIITSLIIGVFLLFLSLGYWQGGNIKDKFKAQLSRNFSYAALITGVGLSFLFIVSYFTLSQLFFTNHILLRLSIYLLLVLAPLVYFLGQTIPLTTNLFKQSKSVSKISGNALFLSTLGSFLGAVLTSLLFLNYLGVALTVFINFLILLILAKMLSPKKLSTLDMLQVLLLIGIMYYINVISEKELFVKTNNYANYTIKQDKDETFLISNFSLMSRVNSQRKGFPIYEKVKSILFKELKLNNKKILVLGAGGFSLSAESTFNNQITYVDIDKNIKGIAEKYFLKDKIKGDFLAEDARVFLTYNKNKYDVIFSDAYSNLNTSPAPLLTTEYFQDIRRHLNPDGMAMLNIIASPFLNDNFSKHIDNTISHVFKNCMKMPMNYKHRLANIIYLCKMAHTEQDNKIYTDNLNQATLDQFGSVYY